MDVYETVKTIGGGSFGQVYLARHKREGKYYVIKKVKTRDMSQKDLENTENEVRLLQKIRHTNIVAYKDSYVDREHQLNIVMIYCDGGDIYTKIKNKQAKGKNFPESQILDWLVQMALALFYLHERKILHRDMKTQNIFLKNGKIRLGDFGIAKVLDSTKDFANTCIGTPYYMSPELFNNKPYSYKSDVWSLGCVLYEMCNLRHAFDAQSINGLAVKIMRGSYPPINNIYSKQLRDLIGKMLQVKPSQRPTIIDILNKMFVRKRVTSYINECLNGPPVELSPTDVDDMYQDSLKEQAQNLQIPGFYDEAESHKFGLRNNILAKHKKKEQQEQMQKKQSVIVQKQQKLKTESEERREIMRLRRELREKEAMEKKIKELEAETKNKEAQFKEKYANNPSRKGARNKQSSAQNVNNQQKPQQQLPPPKPESQLQIQHTPKDYQPVVTSASSTNLALQPLQIDPIDAHLKEQLVKKLSNPNIQTPQALQSSKKRSLSSKVTEERSRSQTKIDEQKQQNIQMQKRPHAGSFTEDDRDDNLISSRDKTLGGKANNQSSKSLLTEAPLNTYQDFKNVFGAKPSKGRNAPSKKKDSSRPEDQQQQPPAQIQLKQVIASSPRVTDQLKQSSISSLDDNFSKERVLQEKERKKKAKQDAMKKELDRIHQANMQQRQDAQQQEYNQFRHSNEKGSSNSSNQQQNSGGSGSNNNQNKKMHKKIEEDYTMFEEGHDDELEDIIEEAVEEESDADADGGQDELEGSTRQEARDQRIQEREELRTLRTQLLTFKEKLNQKTNKIDTIRSTLKGSQMLMNASKSGNVIKNKNESEDQMIDQMAKEFKFNEDEEQKLLLEEVDEERDHNFDDGDQFDRSANDSQILQGLTKTAQDQAIDEDDDDEQDVNLNVGFTDDDDDDEEGESDGNDDEDEIQRHNALQEQDPQIIKLNDRIKFFRHQCTSSLGYNLFEEAYQYLSKACAEDQSTEEKREGLIQILGKESIGFWAILDQIVFYEDLVNEISTQASHESANVDDYQKTANTIQN